MAEKNKDRRLLIQTTGIREWRGGNPNYNRCESTPYVALDTLFESYKIEKDHKLIDFGCGRGRVTFYIHDNFNIPVTGIEVHDITYDELIKNRDAYLFQAKDKDAPINIEYGLAEQYYIEEADNLFYFFNPFSVHIFRRVVKNILRSINQYDRDVDIILYYPMPQYKEFLRKKTPFRLIDKIRVPGSKDNKEKFLIYRYTKGE